MYNTCIFMQCTFFIIAVAIICNNSLVLSASAPAIIFDGRAFGILPVTKPTNLRIIFIIILTTSILTDYVNCFLKEVYFVITTLTIKNKK